MAISCSGERIATLPEHMRLPRLIAGFVIFLIFCVVFVDRCLSFSSFFCWPLCCMLFLDLRLLITPMASSHLSSVYSTKQNRQFQNIAACKLMYILLVLIRFELIVGV